MRPIDPVKIRYPMKPADCFQSTLLAMAETSLNIIVDRAKPGTRRWNKLQAMKEKLDEVDETFEGHLPENWVKEAEMFFVTVEAALGRLLKSYNAMYERQSK